MARLPENPLSPAQQEIMEIIWDKGELAAIEVRDILREHRPVARETVRTMLHRMEEKGWLKHRVVGRTYFYSAVLPRRASLGHKVREIIDTICAGSPERLVTALLEYRGLTEPEAKRIEAIIAKARRQGKRRPRT